jgi:glycerol-1-phosphatase
MRPVHSFLRGSARPLTELYDVALLDLDGVVYIGSHAVAGAPEALAAARQAGMHLAFVTNNAARPPHVVAEHLTELGIAVEVSEIVTSAQAAARYLADRLPAGAHVLVVGTTGLEAALRERGLVPVAGADDDVAAVVQGYSPDLSWRQLAEGAIAINRGVPWIATNVDPTVPSPRGRLPGNGSLVAALRHATGAEPIVTGKPDPTMHRESVLRTGARKPIVVGDRLDTDVEGANAVGCDSLLVLTGVTAPHELLAAPPTHRPTYLSADLRGLLHSHTEPTLTSRGAMCGRWRAERTGPGDAVARMTLEWLDGGELGGEALDAESPASGEVTDRHLDESLASGEDTDRHLDGLRALCAALWAADATEDQAGKTGRPADRSHVAIKVEARGDGQARRLADELIDSWGLG